MNQTERMTSKVLYGQQVKERASITMVQCVYGKKDEYFYVEILGT